MEREGVNVLKECTPLKVIKDGEELQVHYRDHYTGEVCGLYTYNVHVCLEYFLVGCCI